MSTLFRKSIFVFLACILPIFAGEGVDFMNDIIFRFEKMRGSLIDDFSKKNRKKISDDARELALSILDVEEIGRLALGKYYTKVSEAQRKEFTGLFHDLMANRVANSQIPKRKIKSDKIPIRVVREAAKKDRVFKKDAVVVYTNVPHKRVIYDVDFYLFKSKDGLKLYDIHIDESSTLLDFRNQFSRIIKKRGMKYLLKKLRSKLKQLKVKPRKK